MGHLAYSEQPIRGETRVLSLGGCETYLPGKRRCPSNLKVMSRTHYDQSQNKLTAALCFKRFGARLKLLLRVSRLIPSSDNKQQLSDDRTNGETPSSNLSLVPKFIVKE